MQYSYVLTVLPEFVLNDLLTEPMIDEACIPTEVIDDIMNCSFTEGRESHL